MKPHVKLFIPGPVEVSEETFRAMSQPMIGHRGSGFQELYASIQPKLQQVLYTKNPVFISTSSAWGVMEAAVRNLVAKKVLNCCCGAFSDKWFDVSKRCGKDAEALKVEWGQPILPEMIDAKLKTGQFDAITVVHNETSTGLMNPLADIAQVMRKYPDVMFIVDTVSSMTGVKIETDALGIDVHSRQHAEGVGAASGPRFARRERESAEKGRDDSGPRLLLRLPRIQGEPRQEHDAVDAEHSAHLRIEIQARSCSKRKGRRTVTPAISRWRR